MGLYNLIQQYQQSPTRLHSRLPSTPQIARVTQAMNAVDSQMTNLIEVQELSELADMMLQKFNHNATLFKRRDWQKLLMCLSLEEHPISQNENVFIELEKFCKFKPKSMIRLVVQSYLELFEAESEAGRSIASKLAAISKRFIGDHRNYHSIAPILQDVRLFDIEHAGKDIALYWLKSEKTNAEFWNGLGIRLQNFYTHKGLINRAFTIISKSLAKNGLKAKSVTWQRYEEWAFERDIQGKLTPRYPNHVGMTINALVLPWYDQQINRERSEHIITLLNDAVGDPRFNTANWQQASSVSLETYKKWLVKQSLDIFFDLVAETAMLEHWEYRRKFWESYLEHITDAWVVFSEKTAREARRRYGTSLKFAERIAGDSAPEQSTIMMKIRGYAGDVTVVEWSHNGACHVLAGQQRGLAPDFNKPRYSASALRPLGTSSTTGRFSHTGNERYKWQRDIASYIASHTGISKQQSEYRV